MSETTNSSISVALDRANSLRGAYSSSVPENRAIELRVKSNAATVWGENPTVGREDEEFTDWLFDQKLWVSKKIGVEAAEIRDALRRYDYGRKKDLAALNAAVERLKQPTPPDAKFRDNYREALRQVRDFVQPDYILMRREFKTLKELREFMTNPSASVGFFGMYTKCRRKGDLTDENFRMIQALILKAMDEGSFNEPTQVAARIQLSVPIGDDGELLLKREGDGPCILDFKQKTRLVNVVSMLEIAAEMQFSIDIQKYLGAKDWYAGGKDPAQLLECINDMRASFEHYVSVDYSSYDQSIPGWLIGDAYDIMETWFSMNEADKKLWAVLKHDAIHKLLICDKAANMVMVHHGMRSGEMLTNVIDSLCNMIMVWYFSLLKGQTYGKRGHGSWVCNICGDDNLIYHSGWFNIREYLNMIRKVFGVIGHHDKCSTDEDGHNPVYLSRTWTIRGPYRQWQELLVKLMYHEWDRDYTKVEMPMIIAAYDQTYHLGMMEMLDMDEFYNRFPSWKVSTISEQAAKSLSGLAQFLWYQGAAERRRTIDYYRARQAS